MRVGHARMWQSANNVLLMGEKVGAEGVGEKASRGCEQKISREACADGVRRVLEQKC